MSTSATAVPAENASTPSDELALMVRKYRDWRIDVDQPDKSMVFIPGAGADDDPAPAPVSAASQLGRPLSPVFEALAASIRAHLAQWNSNRPPHLRRADDLPSTFAVVTHGVRVRVQPVRRLKGAWYHVRVPQKLLTLDQLGMPQKLKQLLASPSLNGGGLVAVCGSFGSGKTTTVHAAIQARLAARGGFALLLGNPVEYDLAGFHGTNGRPSYIEQIDLSDRDFSREIEASMRNFPSGANNIVAFPELISADGAGEMLRMANRGNLVFADMHASNVEALILNLVSMGMKDGELQARELLANSLQLVVHQHMTPSKSPAGSVIVTFKSLKVPMAVRAALADSSIPIGKVLVGLKNAEQMAGED